MAADLLFEGGAYAAPAGANVELVFGTIEETAAEAVSVSLPLRLRVVASVLGGALGPTARAQARWQSATVAHAARSQARWLAAAAAGDSSARAWWAAFGQAAGVTALSRWTAGASAPAASSTSKWEAASPAPRSAHASWGAAGPAFIGGRSAWRSALPVLLGARSSWMHARGAGQAARTWWHRARLLPAPNMPLPVDLVFGRGPSGRGPVHLHFCHPATGSTDLLFGPDDCVGVGRLGDGLLIEARRSYMQSHVVSAFRLPDLTPLPAVEIDLQASADDFGWSLTMRGKVALLDLLAPVDDVPAQLRIVVDGMVWEFVVDRLGLDRAFARTSATVKARSISMLLDDPFQPEQAWLNAVPMTAAQLIEEALLYTSVGLDFQVSDWTVPAGVWSFTGTPLAVVRRVAEAVGASVQSPRAGELVKVVPRYPVLPWYWGTASPDVTIAADAIATEGYERADRPAYEGIYLSGTAQGVLALVKRAGSAPALLMPSETDPLLTELIACEQRGGARLGGAGKQLAVTLSLPVLTGPGEPGVIDPGKLIRVLDPAGNWTGLVRSTAVSYRAPRLRQTLTVERHL